jgi:hypothetical protein
MTVRAYLEGSSLIADTALWRSSYERRCEGKAEKKIGLRIGFASLCTPLQRMNYQS